MLKAGEFSPNNPLIRAERAPGDVLLGLGEYERRRNTLRKLQQKQYREYLDQQSKKKQEAKEQAERERRERDEKDKLLEERERCRLELERESSPQRRSASYTYCDGASSTCVTKVDTGVQVDSRSAPLSVAVQTDGELYTPNPRVSRLLTQAERELSPHTAEPRREPVPEPWRAWPGGAPDPCGRRRSCGEFDESEAAAGRVAHAAPRYHPSILDGDAVRLRNERAEQEAAERRRFHQRELQHQILEQQRLRSERTARERLLEQAEMRRLEEQLRSLRQAQGREQDRHRDLHDQMQESASENNVKRSSIQRDIDTERLLLTRRDSSKTARPHSDIPENSYSSYDVDSYLRKNLNPTRESLIANTLEKKDELSHLIGEEVYGDLPNKMSEDGSIRELCSKTERLYRDRDATHELWTKQQESSQTKGTIRETAKENTGDKSEDTLPIPVLRHSPRRVASVDEPNLQLSEAMRLVDDKWRVPAVQKNILKSLPDEGGRKVSILTQLGSIRRQLQMEQLKLDKMLSRGSKA